MKSTLSTLIFTALAAFSTAASADSFTVIRDGKEYLCQPNGPRDPNDAIECSNEAYRGIFSREESDRLCRGATSIAPATCAKSAYSGIFSKDESIELCIRANDNGPVDCAKGAYSGVFSKEEAIRLCSRGGNLNNLECAKKAYSGPYTKEQAVEMCSNNTRDR